MKRAVLGVVRASAVSLSCGAIVSAAGCDTYETEMKRVAKRWCQTIQASQVVPVYPLSDDIMPGDVFLVDVPADEQAKLYRDRGFLPFDKLATRLAIPSSEYDAFYDDPYFQPIYQPGQTRTPRLTRAVQAGQASPFAAAFELPRAAFPSYSVDIRRSSGFRAAIPVQSIPVGAGLLNARSATASVQIADAYTYSAPPDVLRSELDKWVQGEGRAWASQVLATRGSRGPVFLRVVQRVYLTGAMKVTVFSSRATSGGLDVGAASPVKLLTPGDESALELQKQAVEAFDERLTSLLDNGGLPGASLRFAGATTGSVSLNETFDRPICIGYLGIDFQLQAGPSIGAVFSTLDVVEGRATRDIRLLGTASVEELALSGFFYKYGVSQPVAIEQRWVFLEEAGKRLPRTERFERFRGVVEDRNDIDRALRLLSTAVDAYLTVDRGEVSAGREHDAMIRVFREANDAAEKAATEATDAG